MRGFSLRRTLYVLFLILTPVRALLGFSIRMNDPSCAFSCRAIISGVALDCPGTQTKTPSAACRAQSIPFLTTLAYCIHERCYVDYHLSRQRLEEYWDENATGDDSVEPTLGWQEAYDLVKTAPTVYYDSKMVKLNQTILIKKEDWDARRLTLENSALRRTTYTRYGLTIFLVGIGIPILLTVLSYLPFGSVVTHWIKPRLIYPMISKSHVQPVMRLFHIPTLGQTFYISFMGILVVVLTLVDLNRVAVGQTTEADILNYLGIRTGALAVALMPLTIIFAGRNNLLLWLTNWSHSTYLIMHRWIARMCLLQVVLHSLLETIRYAKRDLYWANSSELYWKVGTATAIFAVIMVISAQFRRYSYEIFLITHILLAIGFIVGAYYHIALKTHGEFGYQDWIYLCSAIWAFDRIVRIGRICKAGVKKVSLTLVGQDIVRVDVPGIRWSSAPGQHAYLYLPAARKWAPWENHPFSVIPTYLLANNMTLTPLSSRGPDSPLDEKSPQLPSASSSTSPDLEKSQRDPTNGMSKLSSSSSPKSPGVTLFIKRNKGLTGKLTTSTYSALLDGPYRNTSSRPVLSTDRLVLFAGGIGITGVLPFVHAHPNVKLYWSVRPGHADLVRDLEGTIPANVERSILVGGRNDVEIALAKEVEAGWGLVGVVVCGPGGMCDEVRNRVSWLGKRYTTKWELDVEAFLW